MAALAAASVAEFQWVWPFRPSHDQLNSYLKANIEAGEKFSWFYFDSNNLGIGLDPLGSDLQVSVPEPTIG